MYNQNDPTGFNTYGQNQSNSNSDLILENSNPTIIDPMRSPNKPMGNSNQSENIPPIVQPTNNSNGRIKNIIIIIMGVIIVILTVLLILKGGSAGDDCIDARIDEPVEQTTEKDNTTDNTITNTSVN